MIYFYTKHCPDHEDYRCQENPLQSDRLSLRDQVVFWGGVRSWYPYRGYGRRITLKIPPPEILPLPGESFSIWRLLIPGIIFFLIPLLIFPLYPEIGRRLYHIFPFFVNALRPPNPTIFFREMYVLILSGSAIIIVQTIFALIFLRKRKISGKIVKIPWGEASLVGGLLSLGVFGILRGFQVSPSDHLFFPVPALAAAISCWLLISGTILFPTFSRK